MRKPYLYILITIFMITSVAALEIESITPSSTDTGFRRIKDLLLYRDGDDIHYNDALSTVVTVNTLASGACNSTTYFTEGVTEEGEPYDLWYFCDPLDQIVHIDYETGNFTNFVVPALAGYSTARMVAVTEDYYVIGHKTGGSNGVGMITVYRSNNTIAEAKTSDFFYPLLGNPATTNRKWTSFSYYPYEDDYDNHFFVYSSYWSGASRWLEANYVTIDSSGDFYRRYNTATGGIPQVTNLPPQISYFPFEEDGDPNKIRSWENEDYIYVHNGQTLASGRTPNNILLDKNNNLSNSIKNTIQLPNGSIVTFTSIEMVEDYDLITYEDQSTQLYYGNSLLVPKGIYTPSDSTNEYHTVIGSGAVFFQNASGNYKLTGLPSPIDEASFTIMGRYKSVDDEEEYNETVETHNVAYQNSLTGEVQYNPPYENVTGDEYGDPYIELDEEEGVRTEYIQTDFLLRGYDITDDDLYVAYDCFYDTKTLPVIDHDNFENYTDVGYSSACTGEKRLYNVRDADLESYYETEEYERSVEGSTYNPYETYYVDYNTSLCIQSLEYDIASTPETAVTYAQDILFGYNTGVKIEFKNLIGSTITEMEIMLDKDAGYNDYVNITVNGESYVSYDDMIYFSDNPIVSINMYITGSQTSYIMSINGQYYRQDTHDNYKSTPIDTVTWTTRAPSGSFNNDQYLGLGSWILVKGKTKPSWNDGVTFEGYDETGHKYYKFTCDYQGRTNDNHELRVYLNDDINDDYSQYTDRWILYDSNYAEYQKQLEDDYVLDEDAIAQKTTNAQVFWCTSISICDDNERLVFALLITLFFSFGAGILMYRKYENTFAARIFPVAVYTSLFIYFSSIGFFPEWYVALNILFVLGALAFTFNPSQRFGGGGGA